MIEYFTRIKTKNLFSKENQRITIAAPLMSSFLIRQIDICQRFTFEIPNSPIFRCVGIY